MHTRHNDSDQNRFFKLQSTDKIIGTVLTAQTNLLTLHTVGHYKYEFLKQHVVASHLINE